MTKNVLGLMSQICLIFKRPLFYWDTTELINEAKKLDNLSSSIEHIEIRRQLIAKYEKLGEIDKLIEDLSL